MLKSDPRAKIGVNELDELEDRIEKLKHEYDLFFAGIEHMDPWEKKNGIRRLISKINEMHLKHPRLRFRFQSLAGRFVSLNQYWTRMMREIEEGHIQRTMFQSRIVKPEQPKAFFGKEAPQFEADAGVNPSAELASMADPEKDKMHRDDIRTVELDEQDLQTLKHRRPLAGPEAGTASPPDHARPPATPRPETPAPAKAANEAIDARAVERIYGEYVAARRQNNEPVNGIKRETIARQLAAQAAKLREKYKSAEVDFKVVTKDGKVVLRPVVKK
ncbi:MAG: hypothetical protein C4523_15935 [Myxococcales bacterium]|nr:MAG: hypothetical protein C4523_15935 [Myxococcales bacterium]